MAPAIWVEVGPGKFVRVETPAASASVPGPHLAVDPAPLAPSVPEPGSMDLMATATGAWLEPTSSPWGFERGAIPGLDFNPRFAEVKATGATNPTLDPLGAAADLAEATTDVPHDSPATLALELPGLPAAAPLALTFAPDLDLQAPTSTASRCKSMAWRSLTRPPKFTTTMRHPRRDLLSRPTLAGLWPTRRNNAVPLASTRRMSPPRPR